MIIHRIIKWKVIILADTMITLSLESCINCMFGLWVNTLTNDNRAQAICGIGSVSYDQFQNYQVWVFFFSQSFSNSLCVNMLLALQRHYSIPAMLCNGHKEIYIHAYKHLASLRNIAQRIHLLKSCLLNWKFPRSYYSLQVHREQYNIICYSNIDSAMTSWTVGSLLQIIPKNDLEKLHHHHHNLHDLLFTFNY